jgi:Domain of unknown function (DUF3291)
MVVVSVTRLRVRSFRFVLPFIWYAVRSTLQAKGSPGNLGVRLRTTKKLAFWTLTLWKSANAMRVFRIAPPHRDAMRKLPYWCDEASYAHWDHDAQAMPSWQEAAEKLSASGQLSKVLYPSADQKAGWIVTI